MSFYVVYLATGGLLYGFMLLWWVALSTRAMLSGGRGGTFDIVKWALVSFVMGLPLSVGIFYALKVSDAVCLGN